MATELVRETQTCYASDANEKRAVCLVSKRYVNNVLALKARFR